MIALLTILLGLVVLYGLFVGMNALKKKKLNDNLNQWNDEFIGEVKDSNEQAELPWLYEDAWDPMNDAWESEDEVNSNDVVVEKSVKKVAKKKTAAKKKPAKKSTKKSSKK